MTRYLSIAAVALALAALPFAGAPAWAARKHTHENYAAASFAKTPGKCSGGVSTGCSPGKCRCP
jgi:hypothetical protein